MKIHLVANGVVIAAYESEIHASTHARTITGAQVVSLDLLKSLPAAVADDIGSDDWDDSLTPVRTHEDLMGTNPSTPRSKAKAKQERSIAKTMNLHTRKKKP